MLPLCHRGPYTSLTCSFQVSKSSANVKKSQSYPVFYVIIKGLFSVSMKRRGIQSSAYLKSDLQIKTKAITTVKYDRVGGSHSFILDSLEA